MNKKFLLNFKLDENEVETKIEKAKTFIKEIEIVFEDQDLFNDNKIKSEEDATFSLPPLSFDSFKSEIESKLMNKSRFEKLMKLANFNNSKWNLIYRATTDGFDSSAFHNKCDNIPSTITIIKTTDGKVFGGFTQATWDGVGDKDDPNAFIFNATNDEIKFSKTKDSSKSIWCNPNYCAIFGYGNDILVSSNSNTNSDSFAKPRSYSSIDVPRNFQTVEIEVFRKTE